jgi:hypothetical protein
MKEPLTHWGYLFLYISSNNLVAAKSVASSYHKKERKKKLYNILLSWMVTFHPVHNPIIFVYIVVNKLNIKMLIEFRNQALFLFSVPINFISQHDCIYLPWESAQKQQIRLLRFHISFSNMVKNPT